MNKELAEAAGKALTDFLIENYVSAEPLSHIVERQSAIIKKQREEIETLEEDQSKDVIWCGDFKLKVENVANGNDIYTIHKQDDVFGTKGKIVSEADVNKKLRELYFRTEGKRSCLNCSMFVAMVDNRSPMPDWRCRFVEKEYIKCVENKFSHWQPKTT